MLYFINLYRALDSIRQFHTLPKFIAQSREPRGTQDGLLTAASFRT